MQNPFRYFDSSPEVIRLAVMMYIRYPLSLRQVEDLKVPARLGRAYFGPPGPMWSGNFQIRIYPSDGWLHRTSSGVAELTPLLGPMGDRRQPVKIEVLST